MKPKSKKFSYDRIGIRLECSHEFHFTCVINLCSY